MTADAIVGEKVLIALHRRRMTKRALAQLLQVSEQSVGKKINGRSTFTLDELLLMARHFDVPITDLLPGDDYVPAPAGGRRLRSVRLESVTDGGSWAPRDSNPQLAD